MSARGVRVVGTLFFIANHVNSKGGDQPRVLDHLLLSAGKAATAYGCDIVHVNAEVANQLSDHDPQVVRIPLP